MKKFNFLSKLWSSVAGSQRNDVEFDRRLTVGSPSGFTINWTLKLVSVLVLVLTLGSGNAWGVDIYSNTGEAVTSGEGTTNSGTTAVINNTAANGNPSPSWGMTSSSRTTLTLSNFNVTSYSDRTLSVDAAFKSFPNTTNTWPYVTVTFYKNSVAVLTNNTTIKWSSKNNDYGTYTFEDLPDFDKIVFVHSPASGTSKNGNATTSYACYLDNIVISGTAAASCSYNVTLSYDGDASGLHGSFVLKAGSASGSTIAEGGTTENCGSGTTSVVVVPTPDTHYHVASVSATNKTGTISGPDGDGNYTISYTQGSSISSEVTVTFAEDTKHTLTFYNNGTQVEQIQVYEGDKIGDDLPTLTSGDACDATSNVFAGWTTENVGSTPVHLIDADQIVDYWTEPTADMSINALWATTSGSPKAQFIAENETAKTASELDPISLTKNGINLYYESGNIYHSGSAHNFGINADNYCIISAEGLVIEKAVTTCSGSSYKIDDVSDGTLSGDKLSVTDVRTGSLYLFANTNNPLRIVTLNVYTYDNYITTCCDKVVTLSGGSPENGTVTFSPAGSVTTCSGDQNVTMTIDPADGYQLSSFAVATGDGKVAAKTTSPSIVTGNNSSEAQEITLTFAEDANGAYNVTASFTLMTVTSWTWTYNSAAIPNPLNLYVGQSARLDVAYTPSGVDDSKKTYTRTKDNTYINWSPGALQPNYNNVIGKASTGNNTTEVTFTHADGPSTTVNVKVLPLPLTHFVDLVHGKAFADVVATIEDNALSATKTTPTSVDWTTPNANDCEEQHLHLAGWILSTWADANPDATHSEIAGAGATNFYAPGAAINVLTNNGNTYYAVWAKEE